ncbi:DUF1015 domain-containing protein [Pelotomaculum isophthalicicum JI]|uniref:DUF1015 domain-containing protein n=1 Tax=Pelotomaculum isophthalicicum JI TaxID=947010 RepID=A0A9X4JVT1_9FIRM|nr:DUF1015 domain-containing protein [Pelotomaculum isophthalicicum]MDF9407933.1 DUF1015 domain-containing protein [Pelotomaculum isophthalicicum JI]
MATIVPFKGLRYNPGRIEEMAKVVTPPYDVIDTDAQDRYYKRHPYNIIRLEYGKTYPEDDEADNRYTRAARDFDAWTKDGVLITETEPALYLYEQEFFAGGEKKIRSGFICGVKLEPYDKGIVLPHEETIPKHKADRLDLMRACRANFSPIFSLYADKEKKVEQSLREAVARTLPDISFTDEIGESHRMWVITDQAVISKVQQIMADKRIFIADGHHRYETALNYKMEREAQHAQNEPYNYMMMTLVNLYDPGLVVLPTHRLIKNVDNLDIRRIIERIKDSFVVEEHRLGANGSSLQELIKLMAERGQVGKDKGKAPLTQDTLAYHPHVFGLYAGENIFYLLQLKNEKELSEIMPQGKSPAWQGLDVSILHSLVVDRLLGIGGELMAKAEHITYTREEEVALSLVDRGECQLALFLNPTFVEEVINVANNGEKMPQKSTFFYPKLITGLVVNQL